MSTATITLNAFENTSTDSFRLSKRFPMPYNSKNDKIGVLSVSMYNSVYNVTNLFNNTQVAYIWVDGLTYNVTLPEGSYSVSDLSEFIQFTMKQNGHYLKDDAGNEVYYLSLQVNPVYYNVLLLETPLPTTLPTNWTMPTGSAPAWTLGNGKVPRLLTLANNFGQLIGFAPSTAFPSSDQTTAQSIASTSVPIISQVTSYNIGCNWVNDTRFSQVGNIIDTFIPDVGIGELMQHRPAVLCMYPVSQGQYTGIEITFYDQQYRPLQIVDPSQIQVILLLETKE